MQLTAQQKHQAAKEFHLHYPATVNASDYGYFENMIAPAIAAMEERAKQGQVKQCLIISNYSNVSCKNPSLFTMTTSTRVHTIDVSQVWDGIIVDSAHYLCNPNTRRSRCTYLLGDQAKYRIALTTTPMLNRVYDLFGLLRFVDPSVFGTDFKQFKANYPSYGFEDDLLIVDQLYEAIGPRIMRCVER